MPETIGLDLNQTDAVTLIMLIDTAIDVLKEKNKILKDIQQLPIADWPKDMTEAQLTEGIQATEYLIEDGIRFLKEAAEIIIELNDEEYKPKPLIKPPGKW